MNDELPNRAHDMANTIRDLLTSHDATLSEVERLQTFAKEQEARMFFWRSRANAAEARLRELVDAEWLGCNECDCSFACFLGRAPCSRRPEMQS